jgi:hypothetical protein
METVDTLLKALADVDSGLASTVATHSANTTTAHGAVSAATASKIMIRDAAGRAKVVGAAVASDIAILSDVTGNVNNTPTAGETTKAASSNSVAVHLADTTSAHGAATTATSNKIARRNAEGKLLAINNPYTTNGVWATDEYKIGASVASGGTLVSDTALSNGQYLLFVAYQTGGDSGDVGFYNLGRWGTTAIIDTLATATNIAISVNGSYKVVATNNTGGVATIQIILIKII